MPGHCPAVNPKDPYCSRPPVRRGPPTALWLSAPSASSPMAFPGLAPTLGFLLWLSPGLDQVRE